jgi:hypothetical protein
MTLGFIFQLLPRIRELMYRNFKCMPYGTVHRGQQPVQSTEVGTDGLKIYLEPGSIKNLFVAGFKTVRKIANLYLNFSYIP